MKLAEVLILISLHWVASLVIQTVGIHAQRKRNFTKIPAAISWPRSSM